MKKIALLTSAVLICACAPDASTQVDTSSPVMEAAAPATARGDFAWPLSYEYLADNAVLVFSATQGWRHDSGIAGSGAFWSRLTDEGEIGLFTTEDPRIFQADRLGKFSTIVMNSATGDILSADQQAAVQAFVEAGGGLVAQHAMGDSSLAKTWPWWEEQLGTEFISHPFAPQFQEADVVILADGHPVVDGLGERFSHSDEWYTFTGVPGGEVVILAGLDESTYSPRNTVYGQEDLRMGPEPSDHPIVWARCVGEGRIVYSALGHKADSYDNPAHRRLLENALAWVQADGPGCPG